VRTPACGSAQGSARSFTEALHEALPKLYKSSAKALQKLYKSSTKALHEPPYKALQKLYQSLCKSSAHAVNRARSAQGGSKGVSPLSSKLYLKLYLKLNTEL